jgi:large subunit ribosomal protein L13
MNLNKAFEPRKEDIIEKWVVVDASKKILGRLATEVADILRGKNLPIFTPHIKTGARVVIVNASKIVMTGKKVDNKEYWKYTGWTGNKKTYSAKNKLETDPAFILHKAIKGMLRKCSLDNQILKNNLKIYSGATHPHKAQVAVG